MINREALRNSIILSEGIRLKPYKDTVGKLTIGVGRNLDDVGLSYAEVMLMLEHDIDILLESVQKINGFKKLNEVRQRVVLEMGFNIGIHGLKKFEKMWQAILKEEWEQASKEMLDSVWAKQVGKRAIRLAEKMHRGSDASTSK